MFSISLFKNSTRTVNHAVCNRHQQYTDIHLFIKYSKKETPGKNNDLFLTSQNPDTASAQSHSDWFTAILIPVLAMTVAAQVGYNNLALNYQLAAVTPTTFHLSVTFKHIPTHSPVFISVKHSLLKAEKSPWHLDRQHLLFRNRLWAMMLLFQAHFIYLPDGRNLCKVSLFISKADIKEKANLPSTSTSLVPSLPPSTLHLSLFTLHPTYTLHLPPSDLLSLHLCSFLLPVGCSVALIWLFFSDVPASVCRSKTVFNNSKKTQAKLKWVITLLLCVNTVKRKLHLVANCCYHLDREEPLGVEDEVW